jgi:gliding motility-associated-like protein
MFISLLLITIPTLVKGQYVVDAYKYRVTAFKKGNNAVFSESNIAKVTPPFTLYIPNTFTPNGDGMNDTFGVSGGALKEFSIMIYNRWGEMIFESNNPKERWDGNFNGEESPIGAYVYKVLAKGTDGGFAQKSGSVSLVR